MKIVTDTKRIKLYLWIGLAYLFLWVIFDSINFTDPFIKRFLNELWRSIYIVVINFIFFEYAIPNIKFSRKRIFLSIVVLLGCGFFYSFGLYAWRYIGIQLNIYTVFKKFPTIAGAISYQLSSGIQSMFIFGIVRHIYDHIKLKEAAKQLRIEKQEAELNYLKSQTNPHFLFNTLNNIYSLARDKSDLAPESILRLSKILRFMLYEAGGEYICIEQELKIISDYIALETLRYDQSLRINFNHDVDDLKQSFPPLLLIPLVENAFKHGVSETRNEPFVDVHLSVKQRQLFFIVKNSSDGFPEAVSVKENIGLSNLRRQLELLYADYHLELTNGESEFTATLKINLASHV